MRNIELTGKGVQTIRDAAEKYGYSTLGFIRNAVRIYLALLEARMEGKRVYLGTDKGITEELIVP